MAHSTLCKLPTESTDGNTLPCLVRHTPSAPNVSFEHWGQSVREETGYQQPRTPPVLRWHPLHSSACCQEGEVCPPTCRRSTTLPLTFFSQTCPWSRTPSVRCRQNVRKLYHIPAMINTRNVSKAERTMHGGTHYTLRGHRLMCQVTT